MLTTIMKTRNPKYETSATSDALLQEIELQKRIEMWGEGRRLFDMKRRNESLDRTHAINIVRLLQRKSLQVVNYSFIKSPIRS
nr:RagB/SusD family nutrient uptake outer membrane protein [Phocaeicola vulgatus]